MQDTRTFGAVGSLSSRKATQPEGTNCKAPRGDMTPDPGDPRRKG
jgi:hypothetical protein